MRLSNFPTIQQLSINDCMRYSPTLLLLLFTSAVQAQNIYFKTIRPLTLEQGVRNYVRFSSVKYDCRSLSFTLQDGELTQSGCELYITPQKSGYTFLYAWKQGKLVDSMGFRVDPLKTMAYIGAKQEGWVDKKYLRTMGGIRVLTLVGGCSVPVKCEQAILVLLRDNQVVATVKQQGAIYSPESLHLIDNSHEGDLLLVTNIRVSFPDNSTAIIPPLQFIISNKTTPDN